MKIPTYDGIRRRPSDSPFGESKLEASKDELRDKNDREDTIKPYTI